MRDRSTIHAELTQLHNEYQQAEQALACASSCRRIFPKSFARAQKFLKDYSLEDYQIAYADFIKIGAMPGARHIKAAQYLNYHFDDQTLTQCEKKLEKLLVQMDDLRNELKHIRQGKPSQVAGTVFELPVVNYHPLVEEAANAKTVMAKH